MPISENVFHTVLLKRFFHHHQNYKNCLFVKFFFSTKKKFGEFSRIHNKSELNERRFAAECQYVINSKKNYLAIGRSKSKLIASSILEEGDRDGSCLLEVHL